MKKKLMILLLVISLTMAACKTEPKEDGTDKNVVSSEASKDSESDDNKTWQDSDAGKKPKENKGKVDNPDYVDGAFIETTKNLITAEPKERTFGEGIKEGEPVVNFMAKTYDGDEVHLNQLLQDDKMNVLSFFFST